MICVMSKGMSVTEKVQNAVRAVKQTFSYDAVRSLSLSKCLVSQIWGW